MGCTSRGFPDGLVAGAAQCGHPLRAAREYRGGPVRGGGATGFRRGRGDESGYPQNWMVFFMENPIEIPEMDDVEK